MNQPSETIPSPNQPDQPRAAGLPTSPLTNLFRRLRKSEGARRKTRGAFGGKARSARHQGRF